MRRSPTNSMVPCSVAEFLHLLSVCEEEKCPCSVEARIEGSGLDCDVSVVHEVPVASYEELDIGSCVTVSMGTTELSFQVPVQCFKETNGRQINAVIANDHLHAFFNSSRLSNQGIRKARWYTKSGDHL